MRAAEKRRQEKEVRRRVEEKEVWRKIEKKEAWRKEEEHQRNLAHCLKADRVAAMK